MRKIIHKVEYTDIVYDSFGPIRIKTSYCGYDNFYSDIKCTHKWKDTTCKNCLKHKK